MEWELASLDKRELLIRVTMDILGTTREEAEALIARRAAQELDWPDEIPG